MVRRFEGVPLRVVSYACFREGAAMALPGIGIVIGRGSIADLDLQRHEFGHFLQYRAWGAWFYWFRVAPASLNSAFRSRRSSAERHMDCWTEWSANRLSYDYFGAPSDWDRHRYPLGPGMKRETNIPRKVRTYFRY